MEQLTEEIYLLQEGISAENTEGFFLKDIKKKHLKRMKEMKNLQHKE